MRPDQLVKMPDLGTGEALRAQLGRTLSEASLLRGEVERTAVDLYRLGAQIQAAAEAIDANAATLSAPPAVIGFAHINSSTDPLIVRGITVTFDEAVTGTIPASAFTLTSPDRPVTAVEGTSGTTRIIRYSGTELVAGDTPLAAFAGGYVQNALGVPAAAKTATAVTFA